MGGDATSIMLDSTGDHIGRVDATGDDVALRVDELVVSYGPVPALRGVSFTVERGAIFGIIGRNGAGKTTLLRGLAGLEPAVGGRVAIEGHDVTFLRPEERVARGVSLVPEGRAIFRKLTVRENLLMGGFHRKASRAALQDDLDWVITRFPHLRDKLSQRAGLLSGGQQQMLAIGRALMAKPRVLLVDEPSLGLAPIVVQDVYDLLAGLGSEMTVVVVEQHVQVLLLHASELCVLDKGEVVMRGSASELRASSELLGTYLGEDPVPSAGAKAPRR